MEKSAVEVKLFEIRDNATRITAICIHGDTADLTEPERFLLGSIGWQPGNKFTYMLWPELNKVHYDAIRWNSRTLTTCHTYIAEHWNDLSTGDVIDARFILGEADAPAVSDRFYTPE